MKQMKIAVVGTGISGLGAAYILNRKHDVTVFEKNHRPGGHSRTIDITFNGKSFAVDTGFIVFNHLNYPLLTKMFAHLGVPTHASDMSFGASIGNGAFEYSSKGIFAQRRNIINVRFWGMLRDILRFNRTAADYPSGDLTLGELLDRMRMGQWFRHYYLQAMGAAIWSCPAETILSFPAETFIRFFKNHGLLTVNGHPQWHTVTGGSRVYVERLTTALAGRVTVDCGVKKVLRYDDKVEIVDEAEKRHVFDHVVLACHADEALRVLEKPTREERSVLGALGYQDNAVVVHSDASFMPKNRGCWASWVYLSEAGADRKRDVSLSYWMNNLQGLPADAPVFVTLNPARQPQESLVHDRHVFKHPVFTKEAIRAQEKIPLIQGQNRTSFCGAWQRYGFHEDGLMSAVAAARLLGCETPWK
jgi:predicted NAD/FAD-binding protein